MKEKLLNILQNNRLYKKIKKIHTLKRFKKEKTYKRNNLQLKINTKNKIKKVHVVSTFVFLILALLIVSLSFLKVKTINIIKKEDISNITIAYKAVDKYRGELLFLAQKDKIKKSLIDYQSNIKNVEITRIIPDTLKIEIESYKPIFKTIIDEKAYIITENGVAVPTNKENNDLGELNILSNETYNFPSYKQLFIEDYLNKIVYIKDKLKDNLLSTSIKSINYYPIEREAHYITNNDIILIFDLNGLVDDQIEKLMIFNKEYLNLSKSGIIYIDLRIKNKVFLCNSENEYQCRKNLKDIYEKK
ncbi:MAG: FtsQ-type POTRA domain-containing protein [Candidatus Gracilibacteria bacterium]|nr:FtsQ-type POTRA domain-containing protein [Candidatus Gracilibacteria bacterium]